MDKTLKFFVVGVAIAAGVAASCPIINGITAAQRPAKIASLESAVAALKTKCESIPPDTTPAPGWPNDPLYPICDPKVLAIEDLSHSTSIQKEMALKQNEIYNEQQSHPTKLPYFIALFIVLISGIPWSWYFLLRRIRELSDAIRGKA